MAPAQPELKKVSFFPYVDIYSDQFKELWNRIKERRPEHVPSMATVCKSDGEPWSSLLLVGILMGWRLTSGCSTSRSGSSCS
jgi:hypothetical protein